MMNIMREASQQLLDAIIGTPTDTRIWHRIRLRLLLQLRKLFIANGDPLVRYQINDHWIWLPLSHELPLYRKAFPAYSSQIGRLAEHLRRKYPTLTIIDIGANVGDTVAMLGDIKGCPTLCIEADPTYFSILQLNVGKFDNVRPILCCVGDQSGSLNGKLQSAGGTARITTDNCLGGALEARALPDILRDGGLERSLVAQVGCLTSPYSPLGPSRGKHDGSLGVEPSVNWARPREQIKATAAKRRIQ